VQVRSFVETRDATIPRFLELKARVRARAQSRLDRERIDGRRRADMLKGALSGGSVTGTGRSQGGGKQVSSAANPKTGLAGLKILVIDDSKTIRRTAETLLAKEGCQVFTAVDGFDALSKIADHRPDIIFVDIMMPRLDGYQTCSLIKHNKTFKDTPVIMLSSKDGLFDRARGRLVGSEQYLTKPFTKDELLGAIHSHVVK
jgi:twitching motility two-component system response regulator PilG